MRVREPTIKRILGTICAICLSPLCQGYKVGFTTWSALQKGSRYAHIPKTRGGAVDYFVLLADRMRRNDALDLEAELERRIKKKPRSALIRKKYRPENPDEPYRRRTGGNHIPAQSRICSVYMAFWEK
jgi:hypothetical protein